MMKLWKIGCAWRVGSEYREEDFYVKARTVTGALKKAQSVMNERAEDKKWEKWCIWDIGIVAGEEEEMC